ncbi:MAG TPA: sulfatase-like hydrolase/transferase, partial [Cyclobacteriaceae bacterium]
MSLRTVLFLLSFSLVHWCYAQAPNIILIIADDVSWNDIGCYGNTAIRTPNLDRMAREGLTFTNAFVTSSSCSPSRSSIITGRYPHNTGAAELHTPLPSHL